MKHDLKHILARTLKLFGLSPHLQRIQGVVDGVLCDLRDEMFIVGWIGRAQDKIVDETCEQAFTTPLTPGRKRTCGL